ncbi:MAG: SelT/SelW/SelH family protein [Nitrospirae bacterium]|nr:SelT/SelW/SelH family protein [Nitrospirota bacterium]
MKVSIEYCGTCNYRPMAASLAKAIEDGTGIKVLLIHSRQIGAFEVRADDETVYSKIKEGYFPDYPGIVEIIKGKQAKLP